MRSAQIEAYETGSSGAGSVVAYYGNEEDVARGFLIALRAMGIAGIEQPLEPSKPGFRSAKAIKARAPSPQ